MNLDETTQLLSNAKTRAEEREIKDAALNVIYKEKRPQVLGRGDQLSEELSALEAKRAAYFPRGATSFLLVQQDAAMSNIERHHGGHRRKIDPVRAAQIPSAPTTEQLAALASLLKHKDGLAHVVDEFLKHLGIKTPDILQSKGSHAVRHAALFRKSQSALDTGHHY